MCHYKREQNKKTKTQKNKKKKKRKKEKRRKPLIAVLEVVKISGIICESHQRGRSV